MGGMGAVGVGAWLVLVLFGVGLVLIFKGGDLFVDSAAWIAEASGIPKFIIGATVVSLATTMPELLVSLIAAAQGKTDLAIGNAVGSVTANTGLILGIVLVCAPAVAIRPPFYVQTTLMILATCVTLLFVQGGELTLLPSLILLVIFLVFVGYNVKNARSAPDIAEARPDKRGAPIKVLLFLLGAGMTVLGARMLVYYGSLMALMFGVAEGLIGVTLIAVGTSLPELVTAIVSIRKGQASLSLGNIIGANIIDMTLILPLCAVISGKNLPVSDMSAFLDLPASLIVMLALAVPVLLTRRFRRWQGLLMLGLYGLYMLLLIAIY